MYGSPTPHVLNYSSQQEAIRCFWLNAQHLDCSFVRLLAALIYIEIYMQANLPFIFLNCVLHDLFFLRGFFFRRGRGTLISERTHRWRCM